METTQYILNNIDIYMKGNKTMQTKNNEAWLVRDQPDEGVNLCPKCGEYPQLLTDGENHMLRCPKCGDEAKFPFTVLEERSRFLLYALWNVESTMGQYSNETMQVLQVRNGNYLVFDANDYAYLERFECIDDALRFMRECYENDNTCKTQLYHLWNNELHQLFHSDIVAIEQSWEGFDPNALPWFKQYLQDRKENKI